VEWDDNHKSQAAKEVLIKAIARAIPVYVMSVFMLPLGLCDELTKMIRRYWWGGRMERGKLNGLPGILCFGMKITSVLVFGTCAFLTRRSLPVKPGG
jgi:hypothetical protein